MQSLQIEGTPTTPTILCSVEKKQINIYGRSIPENAKDFYDPLFKWIAEFGNSDVPGIKASFFLDYINSISYKTIFDIMVKLEEIKLKGKEITVLWKYEEDDDEIFEEGKNFASKVNLHFEFEEIPE